MFPDTSTFTFFVVVPIPTSPPSNILKHTALSSWISKIGCAPIWLIISAGPVPSFVINNCSDVETFVFTIFVVPFTIKLPSILVSPVICNFLFGCVVPIPTKFVDASIYNALVVIFPDASIFNLDIPLSCKSIKLPVPSWFTLKAVLDELLETSIIFAFKILVTFTILLVIVCDTIKLPDISVVTTFVDVPIPICPPSNTLKHISSSSFISIIGCVPFWLITNAGPVPSFVIFNCSEFAILVFIIFVLPLTVKFPSILALPKTCIFSVGKVVPIPRLLLLASVYIKLLFILIFLLLSIFNIEVLVICKSTKSPDPNWFTFKIVSVVLLEISTFATGIVIPIPNLLFVLSQFK